MVDYYTLLYHYIRYCILYTILCYTYCYPTILYYIVFYLGWKRRLFGPASLRRDHLLRSPSSLHSRFNLSPALQLLVLLLNSWSIDKYPLCPVPCGFWCPSSG